MDLEKFGSSIIFKCKSRAKCQPSSHITYVRCPVSIQSLSPEKERKQVIKANLILIHRSVTTVLNLEWLRNRRTLAKGVCMVNKIYGL